MATLDELLANAEEAIALGDADLAEEFITLAEEMKAKEATPDVPTAEGAARSFGAGITAGLSLEIMPALDAFRDMNSRSMYEQAQKDVARFEELVSEGLPYESELKVARNNAETYLERLQKANALVGAERGDFSEDWQRFLSLKEQYREEEVQRHNAFLNDHPFVGNSMMVAGALFTAPVSLATGGAAAASLATKLGARQGGKLVAASQAAGAGALELGIYGAATAEDTSLAGRLKEAGKLSALGAVTGFGAGAAIAKGQEVLTTRALTNKASAIENRAAELVFDNPNIKPNEALVQAADEVGATPAMLESIERISPIRIPTAEEASAIMAQRQAVEEAGTTLGRFGKTMQDYVQTTQARVSAISPSVGRMLRRFEQRVLDDRMAYEKRLKDLSLYYKMPKQVRDNVDFALINEDKAYLSRVLRGQGEVGEKLLKAFDEGFNVNKELYRRGQAVGWFDLLEPSRISTYWGRTVRDLDGLRNSLGRQERSALEASEQAYAKSLNKTVDELTPKERDLIISNLIQGRSFRQKGANGKPGFTKERTVGFVSRELDKFYNDPVQSMVLNLNRNIEGIAKMSALNKSATGATMQGRLKYVNRVADNDSVRIEDGFVTEIRKQRQAGLINAKEEDELLSLLGTRLNMHDTQLPKLMRDLKNVGVTVALGQLKNTFMQLADIAQAFGHHGVWNTTKAILGNRKFKIDELNLDRTITADLETMSRSGTYMRNVLRATGFARTDLIGKSVHVNARYNKLAKQLQTDGGRRSFEAKWGKYYGKDLEQLQRELAAGEITPLTKEHMFAELADIQPIVPSEMPKKYLENAYYRLGYTLKSWAVKQLNVINERIIRAAKRGDYKTASRNLLAFSTFTVGGSALTDEGRRALFTGEPLTVEGITDAMAWHALGITTIIGNRYSASQLERGDLTGIATGTVLPPLGFLEASFQDAKRAAESLYDEDVEPLTLENSKVAKQIPIIGDPIANHPYIFWLGGTPTEKEER